MDKHTACQPITEREYQILSRLRLPDSMRCPPEILWGWSSLEESSDRRTKTLRDPALLSESRILAIGDLADVKIFRHCWNRRALLGQGSRISFSHLPGVGTLWLSDSELRFVSEGIKFF